MLDYTVKMKPLHHFDNKSLTLDGGTTTVDESYSPITVRAQDRFGFSSIERTFTLSIDTNVTKTFTDLYAQPFA